MSRVISTLGPMRAWKSMLARSEDRWLVYTGAGRATGIEVETREYGALYDFRAGRVRRVRQFATCAEALEAAGLSE
jgi:hypothetical protein